MCQRVNRNDSCKSKTFLSIEAERASRATAMSSAASLGVSSADAASDSLARIFSYSA